MFIFQKTIKLKKKNKTIQTRFKMNSNQKHGNYDSHKASIDLPLKSKEYIQKH